MNETITLIFDDDDNGLTIHLPQHPDKNLPMIRRVTDIYSFFEYLINADFRDYPDLTDREYYDKIRNTVLGFLYSPVEIQKVRKVLCCSDDEDSAEAQVFYFRCLINELIQYENGFDLFFLECMSTYWIALSHHHIRIQPIYNLPLQISDEEWKNMKKSEVIYKIYCASQEVNKKETPYIRYYEDINEKRIKAVLSALLIEIARRGKVVRQCKNCGRYFVPINRTDAIYCDNPSPAEPKLTCKEYGSQRLPYIRQREDELSKLSRNILSKKGTLAKRHPENLTYKENYDYFRFERKKWINALKESPSNEQLRSEYQKWLLKMDKQYSVPEAKGFVYPDNK